MPFCQNGPNKLLGFCAQLRCMWAADIQIHDDQLCLESLKNMLPSLCKLALRI